VAKLPLARGRMATCWCGITLHVVENNHIVMGSSMRMMQFYEELSAEPLANFRRKYFDTVFFSTCQAATD
jgi:hypothetical protein